MLELEPLFLDATPYWPRTVNDWTVIKYGRTIPLMATITVKTTYSLDVESIQTLELMARRWQVSKSEALRRAIRLAAGQTASGAAEALAALDALQSSAHLDGEAANAWETGRRKERAAASTPAS